MPDHDSLTYGSSRAFAVWCAIYTSMSVAAFSTVTGALLLHWTLTQLPSTLGLPAAAAGPVAVLAAAYSLSRRTYRGVIGIPGRRASRPS